MVEEQKDRGVVRKDLGEPVFIGFSDEAHRARRNLILIMFAVLVYKLSGAEITSFSPVGITFLHFRIETIDISFFLVLAYSLVHFIWLSVDAFQEWRIRITGTRLSYKTTGTLPSEYADYPDDPRQTSLMTWWIQEANKIGSFRVLAKKINDIADDLGWLAKERAKDLNDLTNINHVVHTSAEIQSLMMKLNQKLDAVEKTIGSDRIPVSLERFERCFMMFRQSQNVRWLVLEFGLPVILSAMALALVFPWYEPVVESIMTYLIPV